MKKLEEEPQTYDAQFTLLTKGVNLEVQEWVLNKISSRKTVLEIGCGTGILASRMALQGNDVIAIDRNPNMIQYAMQNYPTNIENKLLYQIGSFNNIPVSDHAQDFIVSTFMISELRPYEHQIFLRNAWKALKPNGKLIIAGEFEPSGFWKIPFIFKRWWFKKKLKRHRIRSTYQVKWLLNYIGPIGFKVVEQNSWKHGSIKVLLLEKIMEDGSSEPGYYKPQKKAFKGFRSQLRIFRCLFTGQVDPVPIEPGIYESGTPSKDSPVLVTANYDFTYIKLMRDLKNLDAWILCIDSNGINVWCAARGNDFGNKQLIEALQATNIRDVTDAKLLILPQLSAGGVSIPQFPSGFPFKIKYGPIWSKDIPEYLNERSSRKSENMKLAKFTLYHRMRAWITHTTFLFRKIFLYPLLGLLVILLLLGWTHKLWWALDLAIWIVLSNTLIAFLFPITNFTRRFIYKGFFFATLNTLIIGFGNLLLGITPLQIALSIGFIFWMTFFSTMSFSGYTMATSPREIQEEYPLFRIINMVFLIMAIILLTVGIIFY
jgi:ubiquinone/menaquinone biosynthesis C-methylase UbiE